METKVAKITGTLEMDQAIDRMVQATNDGFSGGKVSKHGLLSWVVLHFEKQCFQACIERIRQDHFDQVAYLESVLKDAKKARREGIASDLASALAPLTRPARAEKSKPILLKQDGGKGTSFDKE